MESLPFQPLLDWVGQNPHLSGAVVFAIAAAESLVVVGILVPGVAMMLGIGTLVGLDALPLWPTLFWAAAGRRWGGVLARASLRQATASPLAHDALPRIDSQG